MRIRWCMFDHTVAAPLRDGRPQRGMMATHLADVAADEVKPLCDAPATYANVNEPTGFVLACVVCLARSELRS